MISYSITNLSHTLRKKCLSVYQWKVPSEIPSKQMFGCHQGGAQTEATLPVFIVPQDGHDYCHAGHLLGVGESQIW